MKYDFFDHFAAYDGIDALHEGGAGEHELVAQGGTANGKSEHTVFHGARGGVLVDARSHQARPKCQGTLFVELHIESLFAQHLGDDFAHRFGIGSFHSADGLVSD